MRYAFVMAMDGAGLIALSNGASAQSNEVILKRLEAIEKENAALRDRVRQLEASKPVARAEPQGRSAPRSGALAAAVPVYKAAPLPPQPFNWTGFYIGAHIGSAWGTKE